MRVMTDARFEAVERRIAWLEERVVELEDKNIALEKKLMELENVRTAKRKPKEDKKEEGS